MWKGERRYEDTGITKRQQDDVRDGEDGNDVRYDVWHVLFGCARYLLSDFFTEINQESRCTG